MIIRMNTWISGGRHDDRPWPPPNTDFEVPDWEGRDLVTGGYAAFVRDSAVAKPAAAPVPVPVPDLAPAAEKPAVKPEAEKHPVAEEKPAGKPAVAEKPAPEAGKKPEEKTAVPPAPADPKAAWIDFAVASGASTEKANAMSKADLMSRYGGRL